MDTENVQSRKLPLPSSRRGGSGEHGAPAGMSADAEIREYRSVSALAIWSFVLGLSSALALTQLTLWALPPLAVVIGVAALRRIAGNDSLTGRNFAVVGIVTACFFGAWAVVRMGVTNAIVSSEAHQYAEVWMRLVQEGNGQRLHQQTMLVSDRITSADRIASYYEKDSEARMALDKFLRNEPLQSALRAQGTFQWEYRADVVQAVEKNQYYVNVPIFVHGTVDGKPWESETLLALVRTRAASQSQWRVLSWSQREE